MQPSLELAEDFRRDSCNVGIIPNSKPVVRDPVLIILPPPSPISSSHTKLISCRPRLRDAMVQTPTHSQPHFDQFFIPYTTSLSVNWPYCDSDVLLPSTFQPTAPSPGSATPGAAPQAEEPAWRMNPAFETHIRNLQNWSLGPAFREAFPNWAETVRIAEGSGADR